MVKKTITNEEKDKIIIWVITGVLGFLFLSSLKELYLNDILASFSPKTILIASMSGIIILYYLKRVK